MPIALLSSYDHGCEVKRSACAAALFAVTDRNPNVKRALRQAKLPPFVPTFEFDTLDSGIYSQGKKQSAEDWLPVVLMPVILEQMSKVARL